MKTERVVRQDEARTPRTAGEWLGVIRRRPDETGRVLDAVLFQAEQARRRQETFLVPARIKDVDDLQRLAERAVSWVWGHSVPTIGISGLEGGDPFGVALAQPRLEFKAAGKGGLSDGTVEALQKLLGLETRVRHLHQLKGALRDTGKTAIFDILSGGPLTESQIQAKLDDLTQRVWPMRIVNVARAINGLTTRAEERRMAGPLVKHVEPFFQPSVAIVQEMPASQARAFRPGMGFGLVSASTILAIVLPACGARPTPPTAAKVSPTAWAEATATAKPTETAKPTATATARPTEKPTTTPTKTETPAPTATKRPEDEVPEKLGLPEGSYTIEEVKQLEGVRVSKLYLKVLRNGDGEIVAYNSGSGWKDLSVAIEEIEKNSGGKYVDKAMGPSGPSGAYWVHGFNTTEILDVSFTIKNDKGEVVGYVRLANLYFLMTDVGLEPAFFPHTLIFADGSYYTAANTSKIFPPETVGEVVIGGYYSSGPIEMRYGESVREIYKNTHDRGAARFYISMGGAGGTDVQRQLLGAFNGTNAIVSARNRLADGKATGSGICYPLWAEMK